MNARRDPVFPRISVFPLDAALQRGDYAQAVLSGANAYVGGVTAIANVIYGGTATAAAVEALGGDLGKSSCYEVSSCLRRYLLGYNTKTYPKKASNEDFWRIVA